MIALIALLALALAAPLAFAQSQGGKPEPQDDTSFVLPPLDDPDHIAAACEFPVLVEPSSNIKVIEVPERTGEEERTISIFPASSYTLTNVDEPENTVTLNTTGAQHQTTLANGDVVTVVTGLNLLGDPGAGFVLAKGNFSFVFDENDVLIQELAGEGELIDVCELLS
jgi:hypothetical protein